MKKYFFVIFIFLSTICLFAGTYTWTPRYSVKKIKGIELGKSIKNFYNSHQNNQVWYEDNFPVLKNEKSTVLKSGLGYHNEGECYYSITVKYYLDDVDAIIAFSSRLRDNKLDIYLHYYIKDFFIKDGKKIFNHKNFFYFDDFEETSEAKEIKKNFEKNVLDQLNINWRHEKVPIVDKLYKKLVD